eukprot:TRINITY_DN4412_c0_g1_i13.p2 TRINITY_DN4412_c0_g1~~TRINITY_DN4412_c0_g1_i13.p2  ORF type:complete len:320 (+),score=62.85 TRINITY_DN4412_c0_g1_i13:542-1501(+)
MENLLQDTAQLDRQNRRLTFQERSQPRVATFTYDRKKAAEMLSQNIEQVETLLASRTFPKLDRPKYRVGQWVDVNDTMQQWLEAQIIGVMEDKVRVHFNGWGTRWDEWIPINSPRIAPFRTYTVQSPLSPFLSPYPGIEPDAQNPEVPSTEVSYEDLLVKYLTCFDETRKMMVRYLTKSADFSEQEESKEELKVDPFAEDRPEILSGQLAPLLDRMGRILTDFSPYFSLLANEDHNASTPASFTRFPAASAEQAAAERAADRYSLEVAPRTEPMIPLMPSPADVAALVGLTEAGGRQGGANLHRIIITVTNAESQNASS